MYAPKPSLPGKTAVELGIVVDFLGRGSVGERADDMRV